MVVGSADKLCSEAGNLREVRRNKQIGIRVHPVGAVLHFLEGEEETKRLKP